MRILVLNPGSSTLKYRLVTVADGKAERGEGGTVERVSGGSVADAAREAVGRFAGQPIDAVVCRVVHGGSRFHGPARVTPEVVAAVRDLGRLAPLHNPVAAEILAALDGLLPGVPVWAVFDTSFHSTMPEVAWRYAIPRELGDQGLRRYGFHGTSHAYVSRRLLELMERPAQGSRLVVLHLGAGCSATAVRDGASLDTSMGLTPLEGLPMGTRSGDVGPDLVLHLIRREGMDPEAVEEMLNRKSGLLGLCGSAEMRDVLAAAQAGDGHSLFALELFAYRLRKCIGAYAAALSGLDAIAFTGGIGEHAAPVRKLVCESLGWLGADFDPQANEAASGREACITRPGSRVAAWVVPTDEEGEMALAVARLAG